MGPGASRVSLESLLPALGLRAGGYLRRGEDGLGAKLNASVINKLVDKHISTHRAGGRTQPRE